MLLIIVLSVIFSNLIVTCLDVLFFMLYLRLIEIPGSLGVQFSSELKKFWPLFSKIFSVLPFLSGTPVIHILLDCLILSHSSLVL